MIANAKPIFKILKFELTKLNVRAIIFLSKERGFPPMPREI